ncbi:hypothetical protein AKJ18_19065 [Vibrio xuii]|nr:hypothetical protein AKJ18_19065 [Vibrio xuii]
MSQNNLVKIMNAKGFTVERLAGASELSESTIKRARRGIKIHQESWCSIASALKVTVEELTQDLLSESQLVTIQVTKAKLRFALSRFQHSFNVYVGSNESCITAKMWQGITVPHKTKLAVKSASVAQANVFQQVQEHDAILRSLLLPEELSIYSSYYDAFVVAVGSRMGLSFSRSSKEYLNNKKSIIAEYEESVSALLNYLKQ